jgi:S1-C subfamily serine protease
LGSKSGSSLDGFKCRAAWSIEENMALADVVAVVRAGIVQISFLDAKANRVGGGTGFLARGRLLTNNHVFRGHQSATTVHLNREQLGSVLVLQAAKFAAALRSGSMEDSFDYAILDIPELITGTEHQFELEIPGQRRMGEPIALIGFPFEHQNLTIHAGIISSLFQSKLTQCGHAAASHQLRNDER